MTASAARVGVVVVNYGTDDLTVRSLRALLDDDASPARRVVLVDNGPGPGLAERVRSELPEITVVAPGRNTGFAGGCNLGIAALRDLELVALVNSDAVVPRGWLTPLVAALDADPGLGAVVPKVRFEGRFVEVPVVAAGTWRPGRGDGRALTWQPKAFEVDGVDVSARTQLVEGFWEPGRGGRWAGERSLLRVPVAEGAGEGTPLRLRVRLATPPRRAVELVVGGESVRVEAGEHWCEVALTGEPVTVLSNVGNLRREDGYGLDRGHLEVDRGQYDQAEEVPAWCGGAVLLRSEHLRDVGAFDERLFLYYEDLELSLRGAARGWRFRYEPSVVVDHRVGASAASNAARSERLKERNRLLVLARHGSTAALVSQLLRFVAVSLSYVRREIVAPPLRGAMPCGWLAKVRGGALVGALVRLPGMLVSRRTDRRRPPRPGGMPPLA